MKQKKIILTVINDLTYDQRMQRICTCLAANGYTPLLVGRRLKNSKPLSKKTYQQKRIRCIFNKGKLFYLEYNIRLFFYLLFKKYDLVCGIDLDTILPAFWTSKIKGKICIYDAHEYFSEVPEVVSRPKVKRFWEWVAQHTIPKIPNCYTVCESLAEVFESRYGTPFEVIRNVPFTKPKQIDLHPKEGKKIILYQGALNEGRGIESSILAMQYIEDMELWLVGEGDLSSILRALAKENNLSNKVKFLGYKKPNELDKITPKAWLGLNLLENKSLNYYYSLANKFFDYIQFGIPSLNMNFPEYQKIISDFPVGLLLNTLDPKEIADLINHLANDEKQYTELQNECISAATHFNWEKEQQKLIRFYKKIK